MHLGLFVNTTTTSDTDHSFYVIFDLQTAMVYNCKAVECTSHSSKAKKLHICAFMDDATWVKCLKDVFAQRRWKALRKNVDVMNFTGNSAVMSTKKRSA